MATDVIAYPEVHKLLTTPEAEHLAELHLIRTDLRAARRTLSLHFDKYPYAENMNEGDYATISSSLFRDGIVLFCACFSKSDPNKLNPETVFSFIEGWEAYCQKVLDIRDCFVAHNFGPQRQHQIVVIGLEIGGKLIPAGFVDAYMRFVGWMTTEGNQLLSYVDVALEHVTSRIEEAEKPVTKLLESMAPAELEALPDSDFKIPDDTDFRTSRSKFRKSGRGLPQPLPPRRWSQTIEDELASHCSGQQPAAPDEVASPRFRSL